MRTDAASFLARDLERAVAAAANLPATVERLLPLAGGASQEAWAVDLRLGETPLALVLRRDLGGALSSAVLTREQEYLALRAMHAAGVPVPRPFWYLADLRDAAEGLPRAAFLMERLEGETVGRRVVTLPALAAARAVLPEQAAHALAAIHAVPLTTLSLDFLARPAPGQSAAQRRLAQIEADLRAIDEPHPALELALRRLHAQAPAADTLVPVHGDFRVGNLVVGPEGLRGVLDWENLHLGDRHADLAWICVRAWRFGQDHLPVGGVGGRRAFYAAYESAGGRPVDRERAFYWEVMGNLQWALGALGQARRHLSGVAPSVELASLGRVCAEMELELLELLDGWERGAAWQRWDSEETSDAG